MLLGFAWLGCVSASDMHLAWVVAGGACACVLGDLLLPCPVCHILVSGQWKCVSVLLLVALCWGGGAWVWAWLVFLFLGARGRFGPRGGCVVCVGLWESRRFSSVGCVDDPLTFILQVVLTPCKGWSGGQAAAPS